MTDTVNLEKVQELFKLGAHLGHKKNRLHPKARKYVYRMVDGVSVIDLTKSVTQLENAKNKLKELAKEGKTLLVVATKKVGAQFVFNLCKEHKVFSVSTKWLPGLLTNFDTLMKNEKKLNEMKKARDNGEWEQFVKHERMKLSKEIVHLEKLYGGLFGLTKKPDALLVLDIRKEKNAVNEATKNKITVFAIADTNSNPELVDVPVVVNDDAPVVVEYVMKELIETYAKARTEEETAKDTKKSK